MKKNVAALCSIALLVLLPTSSAALFASDATPQGTYLDQKEQELKQSIGEKVIFLRLNNKQRGFPVPLPDEPYPAYMYDTPSKVITNQEWAARFFGKTGTVTGLERYAIRGEQKLKWIVTLDATGERIGIRDDEGTIYIAQRNLEEAKRNVGRTFWARGQKYDVVIKDSSTWALPAGYEEAKAAIEKAPKLTVMNTQKLTLTSVELGGEPAKWTFPCFRLADGRNVCAP